MVKNKKKLYLGGKPHRTIALHQIAFKSLLTDVRNTQNKLKNQSSKKKKITIVYFKNMSQENFMTLVITEHKASKKPLLTSGKTKY